LKGILGRKEIGRKFLKAAEDILEGSRAATYASEQASAMIAAAKGKDQTI
jgi:hypothetical protein